MNSPCFKAQNVFIAFLVLLTGSSFAQDKTSDTTHFLFPGPVNQDTTKYATIYIFRPESDPNPDYWQGIFIEQYPMAKIYHELKYIIYCAHYGLTDIGVEPNSKTPFRINISPGEKIYISLEIQGTVKNPVPVFLQLDSELGAEKFNDSQASLVKIYDMDPMEYKFHGQTIQSWYVREENKKTGFNEFLFSPPVSARHYFASPALGYQYQYANYWVSRSYSEAVIVQRMGDYDFGSQTEFDNFVKEKTEQGNKKLLKKSETVIESEWTDISTPADYSYASYIVTQDTKPEGVDMKGQPFVEVRTWQTAMYKRQVKKNKGRIFQITFTERGLPEELHSKAEIFYKMNLMLKTCVFGVVKE
jgi:hypothetical protein